MEVLGSWAFLMSQERRYTLSAQPLTAAVPFVTPFAWQVEQQWAASLNNARGFRDFQAYTLTTH